MFTSFLSIFAEPGHGEEKVMATTPSSEPISTERARIDWVDVRFVLFLGVVAAALKFATDAHPD